MVQKRNEDLNRLLSPRSIAFVGGTIAEMAIRRCVELGFDGDIWPVHPSHGEVANFPCYSSVDELPNPPDAAFVCVRREITIDVVGKLSAAGAGGCVCYAAGFSEMGDQGRLFQEQLIHAAGKMPVIGPNSFGFINFLDRSSIWPYLHGGKPVSRGSALISQSGNIAMNLTMNQRSVNFTHVIAAGNQAVLGVADFIDALLLDERVAVIGMYLEGFDDIEQFSNAALRALEKGVPIVVLKVGKTEASVRQSNTHTSSLTGSDALCDALFDRLGVIRVNSLIRLLETMKVLELSGRLTGKNIFSLSCSGGEASITADLAPEIGLDMLPFADSQVSELNKLFTNYVTVSNPFDYNTSIWGDRDATEQCFTISMQGGHDAAVLIYDHPTVDSDEVDGWIIALEAFIAAHKSTGMPAFVVCTISELLPEEMRDYLIQNGVVPLQGLEDGLYAYAAAAGYHMFRTGSSTKVTLPRFATPIAGAGATVLDEWQSKCLLRKSGVPVPTGELVSAGQTAQAADRIGYPVVVKASGSQFQHKSDLGAVALNLADADQTEVAVATISNAVAEAGMTADQFIVEQMHAGAVAELIVGIKRDEQFGPALVIGAGGILVELIAESVSLLLPTDRSAVQDAINSLTVGKLLNGFRGNPAGDIEAAVDAVMAIADFADKYWDSLLEMDVNPLLVLPQGQGVVAVDALISLATD